MRGTGMDLLWRILAAFSFDCFKDSSSSRWAVIDQPDFHRFTGHSLKSTECRTRCSCFGFYDVLQHSSMFESNPSAYSIWISALCLILNCVIVPTQGAQCFLVEGVLKSGCDDKSHQSGFYTPSFTVVMTTGFQNRSSFASWKPVHVTQLRNPKWNPVFLLAFPHCSEKKSQSENVRLTGVHSGWEWGSDTFVSAHTEVLAQSSNSTLTVTRSCFTSYWFFPRNKCVHSNSICVQRAPEKPDPITPAVSCFHGFDW